jgi:hypothetical protein
MSKPSKPRKLWATKYVIPGAPYLRHPSEAAVWRSVNDERARWKSGILRTRHLTVYVDERDGQGWQIYAMVDLNEEIG